MELFAWLALIGLACTFGVFCVRFLTSHPLRMPWDLLVASGTFFLMLVVLTTGFRGAERLAAIILALVLAVAGYAVMTRLFLSREDPRPVPELRRAKGDPGFGHTAVVYFSHGEPETYDPIGWINQFREWDEQKLRIVPFLARPLFFHLLRKKYLLVGKSEHRSMHIRMLASLERLFRQAGDMQTRFYASFLDDKPRPDAAVIQALNEGASRIVVSEVFLTISNHTLEGKELIDALHVQDWVPIHYTGPLYDSDTLKRMFVQRANEQMGDTDKAQVGVLLVGHGQPDEWDETWPTETEHENTFRHEVLDLLVKDGFRRENLSLAWMEFKEPKPTQKVEEFVAQGVEKVLYFPAAISADGIHSQYDIPKQVEKARVPADFPLINLKAWNDDPLVIQAIKEKIDRQMLQAREME